MIHTRAIIPYRIRRTASDRIVVLSYLCYCKNKWEYEAPTKAATGGGIGRKEPDRTKAATGGGIGRTERDRTKAPPKVKLLDVAAYALVSLGGLCGFQLPRTAWARTASPGVTLSGYVRWWEAVCVADTLFFLGQWRRSVRSSRSPDTAKSSAVDSLSGKLSCGEASTRARWFRTTGC